MADDEPRIEPGDRPAERAGLGIFVRPLASALPLGFFAFGLGMLMLGAIELGWLPRSEVRTSGIVLAGFVAPLEFTAALMAFLARDTLGATGLGLFSGSWAALGASQLAGPPAGTSEAIGVFLLGFALIVALLGAAAASGKPLLAVILGLAAGRAVLAGIYELSGAEGLQDAAGVAAVVIFGFAAYGGLALLLEDVRQRPVLPVIRRGAAQQALEGSLDEQLARARREAGVRRQL